MSAAKVDTDFNYLMTLKVDFLMQLLVVYFFIKRINSQSCHNLSYDLYKVIEDGGFQVQWAIAAYNTEAE